MLNNRKEIKPLYNGHNLTVTMQNTHTGTQGEESKTKETQSMISPRETLQQYIYLNVRVCVWCA